MGMLPRRWSWKQSGKSTGGGWSSGRPVRLLCLTALHPDHAVLCRAARFGTEYKAPEERHDMQRAKQEQPPPAQGFKTGVDLFSDVS